MNEPEVPMGEAVRSLPNDISRLMRLELETFKAEVIESARGLGLVGAWLAGALLIGLGAFGAFTAFFILVLDLVFDSWLSALIVAIFWGVMAAGLAAAALSQTQHLNLNFNKTKRSVKEDIEWIKSGAKAPK